MNVIGTVFLLIPSDFTHYGRRRSMAVRVMPKHVMTEGALKHTPARRIYRKHDSLLRRIVMDVFVCGQSPTLDIGLNIKEIPIRPWQIVDLLHSRTTAVIDYSALRIPENHPRNALAFVSRGQVSIGMRDRLNWFYNLTKWLAGAQCFEQLDNCDIGLAQDDAID